MLFVARGGRGVRIGREPGVSRFRIAGLTVIFSVFFSLLGALANWYFWYQPRTWDVFLFSLQQTVGNPLWALFSLAVLPLVTVLFCAGCLSSIFRTRRLTLGAGVLAGFLVLLVLAGSTMIDVGARYYPNTGWTTEAGNVVPCTWLVSLVGTTPFARAQVSTSLVSNPGGTLVGTSGEEITAFLTAVVADNESICFGAATFSVGNQTIRLANNLVFSGASGATIFQLASGTARRMMNWGAVSNLTMQGITFDGNAQNEADAASRNVGELLVLTSPLNNHVVLDNLVCQNARNGACLDIGGSNITVRNSRFLNNNGNGGVSKWTVDHIHFGTSTDVRVSGNYFNDCTDTALAMDNVTSATVAGNTFIDCRGQLWTFTSAGGGTSTNATVSGNTFRQTKYRAPAINIDLFGGGAPSAQEVTVTGNTFSNLQPGGYDVLHLACATGITVNNNVIQSASTDPNTYAIGAVNDTDLTLDNNTFLNIYSAGAGKDTLFQAIAGFSIQGDIFRTAVVGLEFGCCAPQSSNGVVMNNTFYSVASPIVFTTIPTNTTILNNH